MVRESRTRGVASAELFAGVVSCQSLFTCTADLCGGLKPQISISLIFHVDFFLFFHFHINYLTLTVLNKINQSKTSCLRHSVICYC